MILIQKKCQASQSVLPRPWTAHIYCRWTCPNEKIVIPASQYNLGSLCYFAPRKKLSVFAGYSAPVQSDCVICSKTRSRKGPARSTSATSGLKHLKYVLRGRLLFISFYLVLKTGIAPQCLKLQTLVKTLPLFFRPLYVVSSCLITIINFFPSLLLISNSREAGYHKRRKTFVQV